MAHHAPPEAQGPKPAHPHALAAEPPASDFDALTELFLGTPRSSPPPAPRTRPGRAPPAGEADPLDPASTVHHHQRPRQGEIRPAIEGLILGHLPVMAPAWAMQYARHAAASRNGPVGVVRVRSGEVSVEVAGGRDIPPVTSLDDALAQAAAAACHWILWVDDVHEPMLADHHLLDAVTLLSGVDQAAMVAAFQTIKSLFSDGGEDPGPRAPEQTPRVRIVIVGAGSPRAADVRDRLARAATAFLPRDLEIVLGPQRIGGQGSPAALLYCGPAPELDELLKLLREHIAQGPAASPPRPAATPSWDEPDHADSLEDPSELPDAASDEAEVRAAPPGAASPPLADAPQKPREQMLASYLNLAPLPARCPYAPEVELAMDDVGCLHLLMRARQDAPDCMQLLLAAAAWAKAHRALLELALPLQPLTGQHPPILHLFTDDAPSVRPLADTDVRLHLLAPVTIAGNQGWCCADLN